MNVRATLGGVVFALTVIVSGCGALPKQAAATNTTVQPVAQTVVLSIPQSIKVETAQGQMVTVNVKDRPVFFFAYWCPHCRHVMEAWSKLQLSANQMPVFISTGSLPTDTLADLVGKTNKDLQQVGINPNKVTVLYLPGTGKPYITGYPDFMYQSKSKQYQQVSGDISSVSYWKTIFSDIRTPSV